VSSCRGGAWDFKNTADPLRKVTRAGRLEGEKSQSSGVLGYQREGYIFSKSSQALSNCRQCQSM